MRGVRDRLGRFAALTIAAAIWSTSACAHDCDDLTPPPQAPAGARPVALEDLVHLRDIASGDGPISVSPDGDHVAFQMRRADIAANRYCLGIYVMGLGPDHRLVRVDAGGDYMLDATPIGDKPAVPIGPQTAAIPRWSPDGRWIAFLRRDDGSTQVWLARSDGSGSHRLSRDLADVEDVHWAADGRSLKVETRPEIARNEAGIDREGATGWHLDDRSELGMGARPLVTGGGPTTMVTLDVSGRSRPDARLPRRGPDGTAVVSTNGHGPETVGPDGWRAWTILPPFRPEAGALWAARRDALPLRCEYEACRGRIVGLWWQGEDRELTYMRRQGWSHGSVGIYRWRPGHAPRLVFATDDLLTGCTPAHGKKLVCMEETSARPRHLVLLDPARGTRELLFDPNPEWRRLRLGTIERLHWRNRFGVESFGDLVLPPGFRGDGRLPLIVVQYISRGFLRGGTGDEFPIQLFAGRGFAVLSVENPVRTGETVGARSMAESVRADWQGFANRRNILSSIESGVHLLIARGLVDPRRVGLTGLSDGAVTLQFALLHSSTFSAFATASCCMDRSTTAFTWHSMADLYHRAGWPLISDPASDYAKEFFVIPAACRIDTPLLIQTSDAELGCQAEVIAALRELGKPVDTYVFPGEYHVKWQPAHRAASYLRYLQWFDFWLQNREDPNPVDPEQYRRWEDWRLQQISASPPREAVPCAPSTDRSTPRHPPVPAAADKYWP